MYRWAFLLVWVVSAAAWSQDVPPQAPPLPQIAAATADVVASAYVLQRGDDIEVRAYDIPELNTAVRIRPDGKVSLLLLDEVEAAGKTPVALGDELTAEYSHHFRKPRITVVVKSFAAQIVYVGGEVAEPTSLPLRSGLTAVQAIMAAGGLKDSATGEQIVVVHDGNGGTVRTDPVSVTDVLLRRRPDPVLQPSDMVYVQKSYLNVYVGGEVGKPGLIPIAGDMTMLTAILQAGGFKETARTGSVILIRNSGNGTPVASKVKVNDVFLASAHTKLNPYDVIFVPKSRIARIDKFIDQYVRQLSPAILSFGFSYLIGQSVASTPLF